MCISRVPAVYLNNTVERWLPNSPIITVTGVRMAVGNCWALYSLDPIFRDVCNYLGRSSRVW